MNPANVINLKEFIQFKGEPVSRQFLFDSPQMRVALICVEKGQEMESHSAPFHLVMYCVEGSGVIMVGDQEIQVKSQMAITCEADVPHGFRASNQENMVVMAVIAKCG